jgi:hypothetical protein
VKIDITIYKKDSEKLIKCYKQYGLQRTLGIWCHHPLVFIYTVLDEEFGGFGDKIEAIVNYNKYTEVIW